MSSAEQQKPPSKPTFLQRLGERYRWMSLRNKIGLWGLLAALVIGGVSLQWIQPAYLNTKTWFFINLAESAVARKDYKFASLAFRKALHSGMDKPATWKALAKFLDQVGSPELINVWARLAKMEPDVAEYRYEQAQAAIRFDRIYQAEEVLDALPAAWRDTPDALRLEADIDIRKKQLSAAEKSLSRLLVMRPDDKRAEFDLLCLHAGASDPAVRDPARSRLERIAKGSSEFALPAMRRLIAFIYQDGNGNDANRLAGHLVERPDATVQDRLLHAQIEAATNSFTLPITMGNLRAYATSHLGDFGVIMQWLLTTRVDFAGTERWVAELPPQTKALPEVGSALFPYYLATGEWQQVFAMLRDPASQVHLPPKVFDLAFAALEQDKAGQTSAGQTWQQAVYAAEGQPKPLHILSLLASARGWSSATGRSLTALAEAASGDPSVWWLLVQHENGAKNLPGLYKALEGLMRLNPYDLKIASNWVLAGTLIQQSDTDELLKVAKRTYYSTDPSDAQAATAYAMALLQSKRPEEAMQIVEKMSIIEAREPKRIIYVGAVLVANGRKEEALEYFARSETFSGDLFSEEKTFRRIWKGVALGEATTAEEAKRLLIQRNDPDVQPLKINAELRGEIQRRSDPAEVQRILTSLKAEAESRRKTPIEVEQMMRELRKEQKP